MGITTVRLHPLAVDAAKSLIAELSADMGVRATREDIVSALLVGATAPQTSGMLIAFTRLAALADGSS